MTDELYHAVSSRFSLTGLDIGSFSRLRGRGMRFHIRAFDAERAGRLCLMEMTAFAGLMKMQTVSFSPTELDGPLFSCDLIEAAGKRTLLLELYDTTISHPGFEDLGRIREQYGSLPSYDPGHHWYDRLRLPESDYKKGRIPRDALVSYARAYCEGYTALLADCTPCDAAEKKRKNAAFSDGLLQNGGPAVDTFTKLIGPDRTAEFLRTYMFCSE